MTRITVLWLCTTLASGFQLPVPPRTTALRPAAARSNPAVMAGMPLPTGSLVALATPMQEDGKVDIATLRKLLQWHVEEGTDGVVILGTTGEASVLSAEEKAEVMAATREEIGGKLPIVVGTGGISTSATIAATKQAKLFGADAALIVTPYYVKPSQAGLLQHFTQIADAAELPIVLYNVPGRTGVDMSVETTIALSRHPMIQGLKDATGDNARCAPMRAICGDEFRLYSGEDAMAREYAAALCQAASSLPRRSPRQRSRAPSPPPPIPRRRPSSRRAAGTCCKEETASSRSLPTSRPPLSHGSWPRQTHATPAPPRPPTRR